MHAYSNHRAYLCSISVGHSCVPEPWQWRAALAVNAAPSASWKVKSPDIVEGTAREQKLGSGALHA